MRRARHAAREPRATARRARFGAGGRRARGARPRARTELAVRDDRRAASVDEAVAARALGADDDGAAAVGEGDARNLRLRPPAGRCRGSTVAHRCRPHSRSACARRRQPRSDRRPGDGGTPDDHQSAVADAFRDGRRYDGRDRVHRVPQVVSRFASAVHRGRDRHRHRPAADARAARLDAGRGSPAGAERLRQRGPAVRPRERAQRAAAARKAGTSR